MLGLFGILNLGARSMQVQQQGVEVAGHNLANVNNPGYTRQRINIAASPSILTPIGPEGTGAQVTGIQQLRSAILDGQIVSETSVSGFLDAQQTALANGQAILGQTVDTTGTAPGIANGLSNLFGALQSLSTDPTSLTERQSVLQKAQALASQFNQIDTRLGKLTTDLNASIQSDVDQVNQLLATVADDNKQIGAAEAGNPGAANDLRDSRQQSLEALAKLVNVSSAEQSNGSVDISIGGVSLVSDSKVLDTLQTYDAGGGQMLVRTQTGGAPLALTSGTIQGTIAARDGGLKDLRQNLDSLAAGLIAQINAVHAGGFSLTGSTGANFFNGSGAGDIAVNSALLNNPALLQASGVSGAVGDNKVALALAQLADAKQAALGNATFSENYAQTVASLGQSLSNVNNSMSNQMLVQKMLQRQRDSVSGVSLDEEMTTLVEFQKAYVASAHLVTTVDEMLQTVLDLKR